MKANNVKIHGDFADIVEDIPEEEWVFFEYANHVADQIYALMKANHMNKSQLAGKLGTSKAFVTKVLTGDANLTFKTLTKIVCALDGRVSTKIVTNHKQVKWFEFIENNEKAKTEFIQKTEFDADQKKGKFNEPALAA